MPEAAAAVVKLASDGYAGANHSHLTELLREREGIDLVLCSGCMLRYLTRTGVISLASDSQAPEKRTVHA